MKKMILVFLSLFILFALSACAPASVPEPVPEPTPDYEDEMAGWDDEGFPDDLFVPDLSNTHDDALVAAFTPEGATIHSDVESMLVLETKRSLPDMIAFSLSAAEKLGITQTAIDESRTGFWIYDGKLGDLSIHVELRDDGGSVNLMLLY